MSVFSSTRRHVATVRAYRIRRAIDELAMVTVATFGALVIAGFALQSQFAEFSIVASCYMVGIAVIIAKPRMGVYLMVLLALVGDPNTMPWYPFNKNGSSAESILFIDDRLVATPFEGYLLVTTVALLLNRFRTGQPLQVKTPLTIPALLFAATITIGVGWGALNNGDLAIAINQTRAMIVLPLMYLLFINLLDRTCLRTVLWLIILAMVIESSFALSYVFGELDGAERQALLDAGRSPVEHSSAVQYNVVLFLLAAVALLRNSALSLRLVLPFVALPVALIYAVAERRAAVGGLVIALLLLLYVLARRQPRRFWSVAPVMGLFGVAYFGAFWNSNARIAFPVQALKSQIVDNTGSADSSSDLYRAAENYNLLFTMRTEPLLGIGWGRPFYTPVPLPDISVAFPQWQFFPHNSVLWLWAAGGLFALLTWLYIVYAGTRAGVRASLGATNPDEVLAAVTGTAIIVMITLFSYLDVSFGNQIMLLLAVALAMIQIVADGVDRDEAEQATVDLREAEPSDPRGQGRHVRV